MTITDISEALHQVGAATEAPPIDRLAFERELRSQRRRRTTGRVACAGVAAAAVLVAVTVAAPQLRDTVRGAVDPADQGPDPSVALAGQLDEPVAYVADGRLVAVDPTGVTHEFDGRFEEVVGVTTEDIWAIDADSHLVRWHASTGNQGPGGWQFALSDDVPYGGPVQSAALSGDGRWLGWIDREESLTVRDLKAGTEATSGVNDGYLAAVAQGTGAPLVAAPHGLTLRAQDGDVDFQVAGGFTGWASTATRDRVAVVGDLSTTVYDVGRTGPRELRTVDGTAVLSPYGDHLAVVDQSAEPPVFSIWTQAEGLENVDVPGYPLGAAWADDDTALVTTSVDGGTRVLACEASDGTCVDLTPPQTSFDDVRLGG